MLPGIVSEGVKVSNLSEGRPVIGTHLTVIIVTRKSGHKMRKYFSNQSFDSSFCEGEQEKIMFLDSLSHKVTQFLKSSVLKYLAVSRQVSRERALRWESQSLTLPSS